MHAGEVSMPHKSNIGSSSFLDENGKTDTDCTVSIISFSFKKKKALLLFSHYRLVKH